MVISRATAIAVQGELEAVLGRSQLEALTATCVTVSGSKANRTFMSNNNATSKSNRIEARAEKRVARGVRGNGILMYLGISRSFMLRSSMSQTPVAHLELGLDSRP